MSLADERSYPRYCCGGAFINSANVNPENARAACPLFLARPLFGPLIFENSASDARDYLANERTFLSWLRLSLYLTIVSCAIILSFHLHSAPSQLERHVALPLGLVLWTLSSLCLITGFCTYLKTVIKYSRRTAIVQSGWKLQGFYAIIAIVIIGTCVLFLTTEARD
jgi:uncharacterized membrane protein YidH (DUF202 family)